MAIAKYKYRSINCSYKCNDKKDKICQYKVKLLSKTDL